MYQRPKPPSLWTEFWTLTRIVYGILLWPLPWHWAVVGSCLVGAVSTTAP